MNIIEELKKMPELKNINGYNQRNPHHIYTLDVHTDKVVDAVGSSDENLQIAALLHDIGKPAMAQEKPDGTLSFPMHPQKSAEMAEVMLKELGVLPQEQVDYICFLISEHDTDLRSKKSLKKRLERYGEKGIRDILTLKRADISAQAPAFTEEFLAMVTATEKTLAEILEEQAHPAITTKDLAITAKDLMAIGIKGPEIGSAQRKMLAAVMAGTPNTAEELRKLL